MLSSKVESLLDRVVSYSRCIAGHEGATLMTKWLAEDLEELRHQLLLANPRRARGEAQAKGPWQPPR